MYRHDLTKDGISAVRILIYSTYVYTVRGIRNKKDKFAYSKAMRRCYYICSKEIGNAELINIRLELSKLLYSTRRNWQSRFEIFCDTKRSYETGIEQCLDIVNSIDKRFNGHLSSYEEFSRMEE